MTLQIFLPFYGDPALMRAAVRSVLAQDSPDWTLTVVDDRYPHASVGEWVEGLGDPRVRYVLNEANLGVSGNFNRCLELADGDLVTLLGGDDELLPTYVSTVLRMRAAHPDAALLQPGVEVIDEHGEPSLPLADRVKQRLLRPEVPATGTRVLSGERLAASLLAGNWLYFPALALDRATARRHGFRQDLRTIQDLDLILRIVMEGGSLVLADEVCFRYRRHAASESSALLAGGDRFEEDRRFFAEAARRAEELGWPRARRAARRRVTSRLHGATLLPGALAARDAAAVRLLARHVLARTGPGGEGVHLG
ncbi:glycosyltransferase [Nocardioides solisilvae]|uniref:glycosyltransferase n=1 Tax=Nocardioides solisilvae TaxID=1542435 RepID=UPI0013A55F82|nr:glycosyltransferase [Nocardioides solisilvae]